MWRMRNFLTDFTQKSVCTMRQRCSSSCKTGCHIKLCMGKVGKMGNQRCEMRENKPNVAKEQRAVRNAQV